MKMTKMTKLAVRKDLDRIVENGCAIPGCNHKNDEPMYFHAGCHPKCSTVQAAYKDGVLCIMCGVCSKPVLNVKVAEQ